MEGTSACADCVVTFLCDREPEDAVIIDVVEARALRLLEEGGLAPGAPASATNGVIGVART